MEEVSATVGVSNIPLTAVAGELFDYFESSIGSVFACEIFSAHRNWKSKGAGRVQFETPHEAEEALCRYANGSLGLFQKEPLVLSTLSRDIIIRPVDPRNRVRGAVLQVGFLVGEREMEVLEAWQDVAAEIMPEKGRVDLLVEHGGKHYKLEMKFGDVDGTHLCSIHERKENGILIMV